MYADSFLVDETGVFAAVLVGQVERVAGELHAAGLFAFDEVGVILPFSQQGLVSTCCWWSLV